MTRPDLTWQAMRRLKAARVRAFAGSSFCSTGTNEVAGRHTQGHFDLPLRACTVHLDGEPVEIDGVMQ